MVRTGEDGPKGISALVIEKDMAGVSFGANEKKLGWHSQPTRQVNFHEVRVPVANRVGGEGEGFRIAMMGLDGGRLNIGACSLGGAQRCLDEAIAYTKDRKQFGKAIADFQNTQFTLADMETDLQAARMLLYVAAPRPPPTPPTRPQFAAMAKRLGHRQRPRWSTARSSSSGYGYLQDSRSNASARPARPFDPRGHNQVMLMIVGRERRCSDQLSEPRQGFLPRGGEDEVRGYDASASFSTVEPPHPALSPGEGSKITDLTAASPRPRRR